MPPLTSSLPIGQSVHKQSLLGGSIDPSAESTPSPPAERIAISIISNSTLLREGLLVLLTTQADFDLSGSYSSAARAHPLLFNPPAHVVLLDGSVGHAEALAWTHYWRARTPPAQVIVIELADDANL